MSTLQIQITAGAQAGARLQLNQSPVTFGRAADCTLILDLPVVSRLHGELQRDEDDQWILVNHSANGTRVGRKKVTKKPIALTDGAAVTIGDTEVFRVHLTESATQPASSASQPDDEAAAQQPEQRAPGTGAKGRSKLWIGLGVWFALCLGAMIFFSTLDNDGDRTGGSSTSTFWRPSNEIEGLQGDEAGIKAVRILLAEHPTYQAPDTSRYDSHIDSANQAADEGPTGFYRAYRSYQSAISYSDDHDRPFTNPNDELRYNNILDELSQIIYARYTDAYRDYHSNQTERARDTLDRLRMEYYNEQDPNDKLANHIRKLRNAAHRRSR